MLGDRYITIPYFRKSEDGISLTLFGLLIIQVLPLRNSSRCHSEICFRMLSVLISGLLVSAIMFFRDRFCLHRLTQCCHYLSGKVLNLELNGLNGLIIFFTIPKSLSGSVSHFHSVLFYSSFHNLSAFPIVAVELLHRVIVSVVSCIPGVSKPE